MYHHIIYINIMVKVEMGKVEVQYLYNTLKCNTYIILCPVLMVVADQSGSVTVF